MVNVPLLYLIVTKNFLLKRLLQMSRFAQNVTELRAKRN